MGEYSWRGAAVAALTAALLFVSTPNYSKAEPASYSLDGILLGSSISDLLRSRGKPAFAVGHSYKWFNRVGGSLIVTTDADGTIVLIDVRAGSTEQRAVQLPSNMSPSSLIFNKHSHENYIAPPEAREEDYCGYGLQGKPCVALVLSGDAELILNFGAGVGPDGLLIEVILGLHTVMKADSRVIPIEKKPTPMPIPAAPKTYALDGIVLGSNVSALIARRGKPQTTANGIYTWRNREGGTLRITVNASGSILIIDVHAGKAEQRNILLPYNVTIRFNDDTHMNFVPPPWSVPGDRCILKGSPCWAYIFPRGAELVANFGADSGFADWYLTEVILGERDALLRRGQHILSQRRPQNLAYFGPSTRRLPRR
jgi:hypothetical protein